jgi:hypothetical protein
VAGAVIGGLKQITTSANDAIKTSFFTKLGLPEIFESIAGVRKVLFNDLKAIDKTSANSQSRWGYKPGTGMPYGKLREFMSVYDKSCLFEPAMDGLRLVTNQGQSDLVKSTDNTQKGATEKPATAQGTKPAKPLLKNLKNGRAKSTIQKPASQNNQGDGAMFQSSGASENAPAQGADNNSTNIKQKVLTIMNASP